jgi:hypothetical protein
VIDDVVEVWSHLHRFVVRPIRRLLSSVAVTPVEVRVRNFPNRTRIFTRDRVDRFDWLTKPNDDRDVVGVLILADGAVVAVHALRESRPGTVTQLNNRLLEPRQAPPMEPA